MDDLRMGINTTREGKSRVSTGLKQLDYLLNGGFPKNSVTLISGTPGSGKTIFCFHYIQEGINKGEKCLYLTSDERIENIIYQANEIGFDFQSAVNSGVLEFMFLDLEGKNVHKEMEEKLSQGGYQRIVLDSLTPVAEAPVWMARGGQEIIPSESEMSTTSYPIGSIPATRVHVRRIMSLLDRDDCTAMVTSEIPEGSRSLSRDSISEFLVDGILLLDLDTTMDRRKITIRKMRGTQHTLKPQDIAITSGGIKFK